MARLRTLHVGTKTVGDAREEQHILVLDGVALDEAESVRLAPGALEAAGLPPLLVLAFNVDLPGTNTEGGSRVAIDVTGNNDDLKHAIRKLIRIGDPVVKKAIHDAASEIVDTPADRRGCW